MSERKTVLSKGPYRRYSDIIYGSIQLDPLSYALSQTKEVRRLEGISLGGLPGSMTGLYDFSSRWSHSMGAVHLLDRSLALSDLDEHEKRTIVAAVVGHDAGTPPASHIFESLMFHQFGISHEQRAGEKLDRSEFERVSRNNGVKLGDVLQYINGERLPWSSIVNGSLDVDNADNVVRFLAGMGQKGTYDPERLAEGLLVEKQRVGLRAGYETDVRKWQEDRERIYRFIEGSRYQAASSMMWRALYFAIREGEITKDFYDLTDQKAFLYLRENCNGKSASLVTDAENGRLYTEVFAHATSSPSAAFVDLQKNPWEKGLIADDMASELGRDQSEITLAIMKSRARRTVDLPVYDREGNCAPLVGQTSEPPEYIARVFAHPNADRRGTLSERVNEYMKNKLQIAA